MKNFKDTMKNMGSTVQLSAQEKDTIRNHLKEYMSFTPKKVVPEKHFFVGYFNTVFAVLVFMVISSAGVSYTASSALPGETLFGVKRINEQIRLVFITDEAKRSAYAINTVYVRLDEQQKTGGEASVFIDEAYAQAEKNLQALAQNNAPQAEALRVVFGVGVAVREDGIPLAATAADTLDGGIVLALEPMLMMQSDSARGFAAESSMMMEVSLEKTVVEIPPVPESTLSQEVLVLLVGMIEESTLEDEYLESLKTDIQDALLRGDYVDVDKFVYEALYLLESEKRAAF